jgi:hypothetical protein
VIYGLNAINIQEFILIEVTKYIKGDGGASISGDSTEN